MNNVSPDRSEPAPFPSRAADRLAVVVWIGGAVTMAWLLLHDLIVSLFRP